MEFDEFADDLGLPQHLRDGQHQVRRRDPRLQRAGQVDADHVGRQEVDRLPQHSGLRLDAADAPADDSQAVDHGRVGVRADQRVRVERVVLL